MRRCPWVFAAIVTQLVTQPSPPLSLPERQALVTTRVAGSCSVANPIDLLSWLREQCSE